jgi:threonine/homoserine/homoserine lactone efflux protein
MDTITYCLYQEFPALPPTPDPTQNTPTHPEDPVNLETLLSLTTYAFVTSITPGPNNAMLLASGVNFGLRRTLPHFLGVTLGFAAMQLALGLGVGLAFAAWPPLFTVQRLSGAAYLLYLAWRMASAAPMPAPVPAAARNPERERVVGDGPVPGGSSPAVLAAFPASEVSSRPVAARASSSRPEASRARPLTFLQATAFQWVNPKAVMMCIGAAGAFIPQDRPFTGLLVIAAVFLVVGLPCQGAWAALGLVLRGLLQDRARLRVFNVAMALLLVASLAPMLGDLTRELALGRLF